MFVVHVFVVSNEESFVDTPKTRNTLQKSFTKTYFPKKLEHRFFNMLSYVTNALEINMLSVFRQAFQHGMFLKNYVDVVYSF